MAQVTHWIKPNLRNTEHIHRVIVINSDALFSRRTCASNPLTEHNCIWVTSKAWINSGKRNSLIWWEFIAHMLNFPCKIFISFAHYLWTNNKNIFSESETEMWMNFHNIQKTDFNRGSSQAIFQFSFVCREKTNELEEKGSQKDFRWRNWKIKKFRFGLFLCWIFIVFLEKVKNFEEENFVLDQNIQMIE